MADDVTSFKDHFESFLTHTEEERIRAEQRRDYRDLKQWTASESAELKERGQAPIVIDFIGKKVDSLVGVEIQSRTDPRAYPRTLKHEKAAEAVTDALRYVEDATDFDMIASDVFEQKVVEGYSGAIIEAEKKKDGFNITVSRIPWERCYFDPCSIARDFSDSKYFGITLWMDRDDAVAMFKGKTEDIDQAISAGNATEGTSFDDRPSQWVDSARKRIRINQEYFLDGGEWKLVYYSGDTVLDGPMPSPYLNEDGEPGCPIELQCDYIDRDNNRYGWVERLISPQDEINHRRSKALYMLSSAQVIAEKGAVDDPAKALRELRKAQGFVEKNPNKEFEVDRNIEMGQAQLAFYQEAKAEMDSLGLNPELQGRTEGAVSGRAFMARQQGGMTELARVFAMHSNWKKRVYRQMWARIKQFWDAEKWIRVTDDESAMRWVGLNIPVRMIDKMLMQRTGLDINDLLQKYGDKIEEALQTNPELGQVVETVNDVAQLDMDIIVEESPDTITIQQEQFETLAQLFSTNPTPQMFEMLLKLSSLRNKDEVLEMLKGGKGNEEAQAQAQQQAQQMAQAQAEIQIAKDKADVVATLAKARKDAADAQAQEIENHAAATGISDILEAISGQASAIAEPN